MRAMEELYDLIKTYRTRLKGECDKCASDAFEKLVEQAGVDVAANRDVVRQEAKEQKRLKKMKCRSRLLTFGVLVTIVLCGGGITYLWRFLPEQYLEDDLLLLQIGGTVMLGLFALFCLMPLITSFRNTKRQIAEAEEKIKELLALGWQQMEPLNKLFTWHTVTDIIGKVMPQTKFDPYFSSGRLDQLRNQFGWDDSFNDDCSIVACQSGSVIGNPFVLAHAFNTQMGTKVYHGYLDIEWTETETYRDSEGRVRTRRVTRTQRLHATVEKPAPFYYDKRFLIYGSEAAPTLSFSRDPNEMSDDADTWYSRFKMRRAIKKMRKKSMEKGSSFMMMGNEEFDALFDAHNRTDEAQFRLLFTPVAQRQMLALLRDYKVGYGDDFKFVKVNKINLIIPQHIQNLDVDANPENFKYWNLEKMQAFFVSFVNNYFRAFYFAFAPIFSIPLYQQYRTDAEIYKNPYDLKGSFWEFESLANAYGQELFRAPNSITDNILKISGATTNRDGSTTINVTAHGYRGVKHIEYVSVFGGDGNYHDVPVEWIEYIPVEHTSPLVVRENPPTQMAGENVREPASAKEWQAFFAQWRNSQNKSRALRRFIYSYRD